MKRLEVVLIILLSISASLFAQKTAIEGVVYNNSNNRAIAGANILLKDSSVGTATDPDGKFLLKNISEGNLSIMVSCVGFKTEIIEISTEAGKTQKIEVFLNPVLVPVGEVIVTSTKYRTQIKDVPLPLEIISEEEIMASSPVTLSDALNNKPGLSLARDGVWGTHVSIRGLSKQNIVTLIDGNRIETATNIAAGMSLIDVEDIERVEVIKGASSALYGSGALGGVVNIISKGSRFQNNFFLKGSITGSYNSVNNKGAGSLSFNAGSSNWFAKIRGTLRSADNAETPDGTLENSQFKDNNISANLGIMPFDGHELNFKFQRFYAEDVGIPGGSPFAASAKATYPEEKREMYSIEYRVNNLIKSMVSLSAKYFYQTIERRVELIPNANAVVRPNADHNTNGVQLQTNWVFGGRHFLIAGIDAWQRDLKSWRIKEVKAKNQIVGETPVPESDYRSIGFYAQDEIQLIQNELKLTVGGRIDQIKVTNEDSYNPEYIIVNGVRNDSPPSQVKLWNADESDDISASVNLGLLYEVSNSIDITFNTARSFRSPTLEERYQFIELSNITYLGDPDLEPETGLFFDLGIRVWKPDFSFTGNVFLNLLNNLVIDEWQSNTLYIKNNVGESRFYGFDFSLEYNIYKNYVIYGSAAYVRGEDTETDSDLPEIPPLNGKIGFRLPASKYFNMDLSSTFFSDQNKTAVGESKTPGYMYFDFYINSRPFDLGYFSLRLFAGVENIFDRAYRNHLSTYRGLLKTEPGRNFFAKIAMDF
ncbi:MAG: TonB-dependent receptor [Ignavibacteria bacterium]|jgi:hemoglobin/transferrin/lactoferrin receptor protein